jgi:hypothetical protein
MRKGLRPYRDVFRRAKGGTYVSRDVTGLSVSPHTTLPGIDAEQVGEAQKPTRRARHEAVWEAGRRSRQPLAAASAESEGP